MEGAEHALFNKLILAIKDLQICFVNLNKNLDTTIMQYNRVVELTNEIGAHIPERGIDDGEDE